VRAEELGQPAYQYEETGGSTTLGRRGGGPDRLPCVLGPRAAPENAAALEFADAPAEFLQEVEVVRRRPLAPATPDVTRGARSLANGEGRIEKLFGALARRLRERLLVDRLQFDVEQVGSALRHLVIELSDGAEVDDEREREPDEEHQRRGADSHGRTAQLRVSV